MKVYVVTQYHGPSNVDEFIGLKTDLKEATDLAINRMVDEVDAQRCIGAEVKTRYNLRPELDFDNKDRACVGYFIASTFDYNITRMYYIHKYEI